MNFIDFSRIGSAKADLNRNEKFSIASIEVKGKSGHYDFHSASDLTPIKPSGTPNAKALKLFGIALSVVVSVALVISLVVCLVVFLGNREKNTGNDKEKTTVIYQKDKFSPTTSGSIGILTTATTTTTAATTTIPAAATQTSTLTTEETAFTTTTSEKTSQGPNTESTSSTANFETVTQSHSSTGLPVTIVNGTWSNWGPWTMCAVTCGNSIHSRYRTCIKNSVNDTNCIGNYKEEKDCTTTTCPVYGIWTTWMSWSNCDVTCGGGTQNRSRTCVKVENTDKNCVGMSTQQQTCSEWACPDCTKTCTTGTLNSECDACECTTNVQGLVRNLNGGLLNNVSIVHESAPYRQITTTNANGTFELNNVCNQNDIIFKRQGYQDTTLKITSSSLIVIMQLIQYPVITTQPTSRRRLEGESVQFCCNATGNPEITSYEWIKNGNLINESFYPDGTTLILTDLKFTDSGIIKCRANSKVGAVFSDSVSLSVRENANDFCADAYAPHEINLPSDCIQENTNSTVYDIGKCSPKQCRKNDSNVEQSCVVDTNACCVSSKRERRIIQCSGYTLPLYVTTTCVCGDCEDAGVFLHGQAVGASSGLPLQLGTIEINGNFVDYTGIFGDFKFTVPRGTTRIAVTFKDTYFNNFEDTLKIIRLNEEISGSFYINVKMIDKSVPVNINSTVTNTLQLGEDHGTEGIASLTIPQNSIFYPNGTQFNGIVKASLMFFDPRNSSSLQNAPGEFVSVDQEGELQNLQSFGVFSLSLHDQTGSRLEIAGETEIRLDQTFFESNSLGNSSDAKLWGLNLETGIWEEQATLKVLNSERKKRETTFLVGSIQLSAYKWVNLDKIFWVDRCYFKIRVFEGGEEKSQINYRVRVIVESGWKYSVMQLGSIAYTEQSINPSTNEVWTMCKDEVELRGYIQVEKNGKMVHADKENSGLDSIERQRIDYQILEDDRTVSAKLLTSNSGPFYRSFNTGISNIFRFHLQKDEYSFTILPPRGWQQSLLNKDPGNQVWYPPLNSVSASQLKYRTCFIKIGTENANPGLLFRVISKNEESTIVGIHEKGLTDGATCIEYRCSVPNPNYNDGYGNILKNTDTKFTLVQILPINQVCSVSNESSEIRSCERSKMNFSSQKNNVGSVMFEANIPDIRTEGIYFQDTDLFNKIEIEKQNVIGECKRGIHTRYNTTMHPDIGLAVKFRCL